MKQIKERYQSCISQRRITVDVLAILFGMGSWIGINGVFVQLPLLVKTAPESWALPSYMSVAVQLANIGPITYALLRKMFPIRLNDAYCIYFILFLGVLSSTLLAFFYNYTSYIGEQEHSTIFLGLVFLIAIVGCTSSVLFFPFMRHYKQQYLISYFIGEGLSGFVPSIVALIQGVQSSNCAENSPDCQEPNFSTNIFFAFLATASLISLFSAVLLNTLEVCKSEMVTYKNSNMVKEPSEELDLRRGNDPNKMEQNSYDSISLKSDVEVKSVISLRRSISLLLLIALVCAFSNGIFPSVQSYSCLPYGSIAYHLAATLSSMANPIACFLAMFLPHTTNRAITILSVICAAFTSYIMATSILSPKPPLYDVAGGKVLVVFVWIMAVGLVSYIKLCISTVFRIAGGSWMFYCGSASQAGSAVGSLVLYFLINYTQIFQSG